MDISMPGFNRLQTLARITRDFPQVRVILLSMHYNVTVRRNRVALAARRVVARGERTG